MIFENRVRVENHFPVEIFEIFHFQKHAPNMDISRVKKFQNSKNMKILVEDDADMMMSLCQWRANYRNEFNELIQEMRGDADVIQVKCLSILNKLNDSDQQQLDIPDDYADQQQLNIPEGYAAGATTTSAIISATSDDVSATTTTLRMRVKESSQWKPHPQQQKQQQQQHQHCSDITITPWNDYVYIRDLVKEGGRGSDFFCIFEFIQVWACIWQPSTDYGVPGMIGGKP